MTLTLATLVVAVTACSPPRPPLSPDQPGRVADPSPSPSPPRPSPSRVAETETQGEEAILLAVGDIASCDKEEDEAVAELVRSQEGTVALLGDIVYPSGSVAQYAECFDPAWGPVRHRLRPAPGNHDFRTPGGAGYFGYFGGTVGRPGQGWYFYDLGPDWRAVVLNSNCALVGGCGSDSPQGQWLRQTLRDAGDRNVLAYWHQPRFSTGRHGSDPAFGPFWELLYRSGVDIVLNGHDHVYERFAPQNPQGRPDPAGVRQFTVGVGGFNFYEFSRPPLPATEARNNDTFGVLQLRLRSDGYSWQFLPTKGTFSDAGRHRIR